MHAKNQLVDNACIYVKVTLANNYFAIYHHNNHYTNCTFLNALLLLINIKVHCLSQKVHQLIEKGPPNGNSTQLWIT